MSGFSIPTIISNHDFSRSRLQKSSSRKNKVNKENICYAIADRANAIACAVVNGDRAIIGDIIDTFHTKWPELQALLLAFGLLVDDREGRQALSGFIYALRLCIDADEDYVYELPHPAPRYTGWLRRRQRLAKCQAVASALQNADSKISCRGSVHRNLHQQEDVIVKPL